MKLTSSERKAICITLKREAKSVRDQKIDAKRESMENDSQLKELAKLEFEAISNLSQCIKDEFIGNISENKILDIILSDEVDNWEKENCPRLLPDDDILGQILLLESSVRDLKELKEQIKFTI